MKNRSAWLIPVRCIVFILVFVLGAAIMGKDVSSISNWWTTVVTIVNILTVVMLVVFAKKNGKTYLELINYKKGNTKIRQVVITTIVIFLVGIGGMYLAGFLCYGVIPYASPMMIEPVPAALAVINFLLLPVTTALAEDGLYLGCGVNGFKNKIAAIAVPAFFYALQHCFIPVLWDPRYIIYRFLSYLPLTIILCWYYHKKRNPLPAMVGHALIDVMTVAWVLATSLVPGFYEQMLSMG